MKKNGGNISKHYIIIAVLCLVTGLSLMFASVEYEKSKDANVQSDKVNQLLDEYANAKTIDSETIKKLTDENEKLKDKLKALSDSNITIDNQLQSYNMTRDDILSDLEKQSDLISFEGVLGGKMQYFSSESSVISTKWVLGYFEDGHIFGYSLLQYTIEDQGNIKWKIIDSYLLDE